MHNSGYLTSIAGVITNRFTQVVIQVLLARILSGPDYSSFYFHYAAITGLSMFIGDGLGLASSRLIATHQSPSAQVTNAAISAGFIGSIFAGCLLIIHSFFLSHEPLTLPILALVVMYSFNLSFLSVLQYITICINERAYLARIQIGFSVLAITSTLLAGHFWGWSGSLAGLLICAIGSNILLLQKTFHFKNFFSFFSNSRAMISELLKNALPICGSMALGGPIHVYCLTILQSTTLDRPNELGIFGLSFVCYTLVSFLPGAFGQFLVPWLLKNQRLSTAQAFRYVTKLYAIAGSFLLIGITLANFIGLERLIPTLAHAQQSVYILSFTGFIAGFIALYSFFLNATYKSNFVLLSTIYHSISYILLTYLFVKYLNWGAVGLACAILLSSTGQLVILTFIKKVTEKEEIA